MKKYQLDFEVKENNHLAEGYHQLLLSPIDVELPEMYPGQFVNILVPDSKTTFLRRPISVNMADYDRGLLSLVVKEVGEGTRHLCDMKCGEKLNIIVPLGHGFTVDFEAGADLLLVGGGVGAAPLLYLSKVLSDRNCNVRVLIGARKSSDLTQLEDFSRYAKVEVTTEDGSAGVKGFVTHHPWLQDCKADMIMCCGPMPMMKSVARVATESGVKCEVSLENSMACGVGACLCCVEKTTEGHQCVCTSGPVFDIKHLENF